MLSARYLPLPIANSWSAQARLRGAQWWRRRAIRATFAVVLVICVVAFLRYTACLPGLFSGDSGVEDEEEFDPSLDASYVPFKPSGRPPATNTLKPGTGLPSSCLDAHIAQGQLCYNAAEPRLDVLWTWVNGSDVLLQDALTRIENSFPEDSPYRPTASLLKLRQYRDHDELRFSMRSALKFFKESAGNFHLVASDFGIYEPVKNSSLTSEWRMGQIPQWLDLELGGWQDDNVKLSTIHHADIFDPYKDTIFNSYAIESQFGHLQGVSENFVYMNDDFFFFNNLSRKSFYTSPYGMVLRMQSDLMVSPVHSPSSRGEWRSLDTSNGLLSNRFGKRHRPYVTHEAKSSSISLLHEMSHMWPSSISKAAMHPFRETKAGEGDLSMMFMMVHFVVERWREALLWSWVVGKHGGLDDSWGEEETARVWGELGGAAERTEKLVVRAGKRGTMEAERIEENLQKSGLEGSDPTKYIFSSQDGYPYTGFKEGKNKWPRFGSDVYDVEVLQCSIDPKECFADENGKPFTRASDAFTNIAFRNYRCGDCVITALVKASGDLGLSAFLPPSSRSLSSLAGKVIPPIADPIPHLPLVDKWQDGKFSLRDVMGAAPQMTVRDWTLRLLQRYRFVIGDTPSHFSMITGPSDVLMLIRKLRREREITLLCINDDVARQDDTVADILQKWFREMWPTPAAWEKQ